MFILINQKYNIKITADCKLYERVWLPYPVFKTIREEYYPLFTYDSILRWHLEMADKKKKIRRRIINKNALYQIIRNQIFYSSYWEK